MKNNNKCCGIASGVEFSLVITQLDSNYALSIQKKDKISNNPKIALIASKDNLKKFMSAIKKEVNVKTTPHFSTVASINCVSYCEELKLIKVDKFAYELIMYYSYRRPRNKHYADSVALTNVDLEKLVEGFYASKQS